MVRWVLVVEVERGGRSVQTFSRPGSSVDVGSSSQPHVSFQIDTVDDYILPAFAQFYSSVCAPVCVCVVCVCAISSLSIEIRKKTRFQFIFPHSSELTRRRKFRVLVFLLLAPVFCCLFSGVENRPGVEGDLHSPHGSDLD